MLMSDDAILAVLVAMVSILLVCAAVVVAAGA
jgi:hypothetical protein